MLTRRIVDFHLIAFEPERVLPLLAPNVRAMYENRRLLRLAPCTDFVISLLSRLVIDATDAKVRFRSYECLRTIKIILRAAKEPDELVTATKSLLFSLYQQYVFSQKEEVLWCISTYLKDRKLHSDQIHWLIRNAGHSVHVLNRLLKYPDRNDEIKKWAAIALKANTYPDRTAELAGLLILTTFPKSVAKLSAETLLWAAYYSRATVEQKGSMLLRAATPNSADTVLNIALRLRLPEVLRHLSQIVPEGA